MDYNQALYKPSDGQEAAAEFVWARATNATATAAAAPSPASQPGPTTTPSTTTTSTTTTSTRLAAAADLARRCAELGVRPPMRAAPQPPAPPAPPERLAGQVEQQGSLLSAAVQGQAAQLAAQQRLLQDVVQGLLFMGAKASSGGSGSGSAGGAAVPTSATAAPRAPVQPAHRAAPLLASPRPVRPPSPAVQRAAASPARRTSALVQGLQLQGPPGPAAEGGRSAEGREGRPPAASSLAAPAGLLRVPVLAAEAPRPGRREPDTAHPAVSLRSRPDWDGRIPVAEPLRRSADSPAYGRRLAPGGLGPQLLLHELRRLQGLQRRQSTGSSRAAARSTARRALPQQPPIRPVTAPPAARSLVGGKLVQPVEEAAELRAAAPLRSTQPALPVRSQPLTVVRLTEDAQLAPAAQAAGEQRAASPVKRPGSPPPPPLAQPPRLATVPGIAAPAVRLGSEVTLPEEQPALQLGGAEFEELCGHVFRALLLRECAPAVPLQHC